MEGAQFDAQARVDRFAAPTIETMIAYKKRTGVASIEDARQREVIVGSIGSSGITYMYPLMLNDMAGTKFRMVPGYTALARSTLRWSEAKSTHATIPGEAESQQTRVDQERRYRCADLFGQEAARSRKRSAS